MTYLDSHPLAAFEDYVVVYDTCVYITVYNPGKAGRPTMYNLVKTHVSVGAHLNLVAKELRHKLFTLYQYAGKPSDYAWSVHVREGDRLTLVSSSDNYNPQVHIFKPMYE